MGTALDRPLSTTAAEWTAYTPQATAGNSDVGQLSSGWLRPTPTEGAATRPPRRFRNTRRLPRTLSNTAPKFPAGSTARAMEEEMPKGTAIGNPVTATDKDSGEMLTYWLSRDRCLAICSPSTRAPGSWMVNVKLNYESDAGVDDQCGDKKCMQSHRQWWLTRPALTPPTILQALTRPT